MYAGSSASSAPFRIAVQLPACSSERTDSEDMGQATADMTVTPEISNKDNRQAVRFRPTPVNQKPNYGG